MIECVNGCGPMSRTLYEGVEIDICTICAGVWLDTGELPAIIATHERTWPEDVVRKVLASTGTPGISTEELTRTLTCPRCNTEMPPNNYQGSSGIIVNTCDNDHGIWLDAGELAKIQIYMEKWDTVFNENSPTDEEPPPSSHSYAESIRRFLGKLAHLTD